MLLLDLSTAVCYGATAMGFFGILKKVGGAVLKAGLSKVSGGVSDSVLKVLKGRGQAKATLAKQSVPMTEQEMALVRKLGPDRMPSVRQTETIMDAAVADNLTYGKYGRKSRVKRKPRAQAMDMPTAKPRRSRRGGLRPGMLNLAAMAAQWRAAGKPGSWRQWIKSKPLYA